MSAPKTNPIVIIGGGFGGLQVALQLDRLLGHKLDSPIFLIDSSPFHIYTPSLYELANAHSPRTAVIPFEEILEGTNVQFIQEKVTHIDTELRSVTTEHRQLPYGDLVLAVGSQSRLLDDKKANPADIFMVKTLDDVLAIREHIEMCFRKAEGAPKNKWHTHFIIAGAGPTGVEFAASLAHFLKKEEKYHGVSARGVMLTLVDAGDRILSRLDPKVSQLTEKYLKQMGITIRLKTKISWQDHEKLKMNKTVTQTETLIWTAGVKPNDLLLQIKSLRQDDHGHILVDGSLQAIGVPNVWVVGDAAAVSDSGLALSAVAHGRHVARAIRQVRNGEIALAYQPRKWQAVIPLSDSYGVARIGNSLLEGFSVIIYKRFLDFKYYLSILPLPLAYKVWTARGCVSKRGGVFCIEPYSLKS